MWSAGTVSTNVKEASIFINALTNNQLTNIIHEWKALPNTPIFNIPCYYSYHLMKINTFVGHSGSIPGYTSYILYEQDTNTTLIVVVNLHKIRVFLLQVLLQSILQDWLI